MPRPNLRNNYVIGSTITQAFARRLLQDSKPPSPTTVRLRFLSIVSALLPILLILLFLFAQSESFTLEPPRASLVDRSEGMKVIAAESATVASEEVKCSLWLVPPVDHQAELMDQIRDLAAKGRGPIFEPHVTIVGNIRCGSEEEIDEIIARLSEFLRGSGSIPCTFSPVAQSEVGHWNQALVVSMDTTDEFLELCRRSKLALGMNPDDLSFPAPIKHPHLSMFYGEDCDIPDVKEVKEVLPFMANRVALWKTNPPTLQGVPKWEELAVFSLDE